MTLPMCQKVNKLFLIFLILGIGYIKKQAKNQVTWLKPEIYENDKDQERKSLAESPIKTKIKEYQKLAKKIEDFAAIAEEKLEEIKNKESNSRNFFLTYDDIKTIFNKYPEDTSIAVTVPEDVHVEMLEEENRRETPLETSKEMSEATKETMENMNEGLSKSHQIYFYSNTIPINAYLLMDPGRQTRLGDNEEENTNRIFDPMCSNGRNSRDSDTPSPSGFNFRNNFLNFNDGFLNQR